MEVSDLLVAFVDGEGKGNEVIQYLDKDETGGLSGLDLTAGQAFYYIPNEALAGNAAAVVSGGVVISTLLPNFANRTNSGWDQYNGYDDPGYAITFQINVKVIQASHMTGATLDAQALAAYGLLTDGSTVIDHTGTASSL